MSPRSAPVPPRRVLILGSTGSIGTQAIDVINHVNRLHREGAWGRSLEVVGLAARSRAGVLFQQAEALGIRDLALSDGGGGDVAPAGCRLRTGEDAAERLVREVECDVVVAAMVGVAGLPATLAAIESGRDVALANKETLVAAGSLVVPAARRSGSRLLPIDSEHSGVWQCLRACDVAPEPDEAGPPRSRLAEPGGMPWPPLVCGSNVARVTLTASGGPFRTWTKGAIDAAGPEQALRHPTWSMGPKVTVDSASLMNKGLELIEAHWLFGLDPARLGVLVHPQSIVHALIEHADGSVIAQLGSADMRTPIMHALLGGGRASGAAPRLDLAALRTLEFEPWDPQRFPAIGLAMRAMEAGGTAGAVLNGANEEAVRAFLGSAPRGPGGRRPAFGEIVRAVEAAMGAIRVQPITSAQDVLSADRAARQFVRSLFESGWVGV